jgi:hypothetical protein
MLSGILFRSLECCEHLSERTPENRKNRETKGKKQSITYSGIVYPITKDEKMCFNTMFMYFVKKKFSEHCRRVVHWY